MDFSLSSSLVGNAVSNPDKLALDLQFAADKTLTARKGPTPSFTRASSGTFVGSNGLIQSAGNNVARFDHDPVSLACKGLLIEESRTNLVFPSATLTTQTRTVTAVAHTLSFYGTGTVVLSGVAIATVTGTGAYPTRTTLTFTPTAGSLIMTVTGSVTQAQLEAGSFPTSYIPTTTASVIRSADVCSITGSAFSGFYNQTEGTALVKTIGGDSVSSRDLFRFNETIAPIDSIFISGYSRFLAAEVGVITNNSQQFVHFGSLTRNFEKLSLAYAQNNAAYARNGTIEATDTSVTTSSLITQLFLGEGGINGCISSFSYYKKRLSNAKLRALTV